MRLKDLEIQRWAHGGDAVAIPVGGPLAGMIVFVPGAVPGDVVHAEVIERKKRWARAAVAEVVRASPERVDVPCSHQTRCGGCPWMTGSARAQAASRLAILEGEARKRLGWSDEEIHHRVGLASDEGPALGYRARLRLAYRVTTEGRVTLGFRGQRSHALVDVETCAVATPALSDAFGSLRTALEEGGAGQGEVHLLAGEEGVGAWVQPGGGPGWRWGAAMVTVAAGSYRWTGVPEGFFQANPSVTAGIADAIHQAVGSPETPTAHAVELFAGGGSFTVPLLRAGYRVTAYELAGASAAQFKQNTDGVGEATFHVSDLLSAGVPLPAPAPAEVILLDPPRAGAREIMPWVRASGARCVVLVSCDVSTAMRDLAELQSTYSITSIRGWNMFPHTGHQEVVAVLARGASY